MAYKAGSSFSLPLLSNGDGLRNPYTGDLANFDGTPAAVFRRNGADTAATATVTNIATGDYVVSGTVPAYTLGDDVQVKVTGAVGGQSKVIFVNIGPLDEAVSSRSTYAGGDTSGVTTLLARIPGTVAAQTGDAYARIGSNGSGLTAVGLASAQRVKLDAAQPDYAPAKVGDAMTLTSGERLAIAAAIEVELMNEGTGGQFMQAIADKLAADFDIENLTVATIASACRDAILNRVLAGNHDTAGTAGLFLQKLNVSGVLAHTDNANLFMADVSGLMLASSYVAPNNPAIATTLGMLQDLTVDNGGSFIFNSDALQNAPTSAILQAIDLLGAPQQADAPVVLPTTPPAGYGGSGSGSPVTINIDVNEQDIVTG